MKLALSIVVVLLLVNAPCVHAQRSSIVKKDFNINDMRDSANIVVIKTDDIPSTLNKSLAPGRNQKIAYPTTFYTNPANKVHVVHVNNHRGNNTYVFENNPQVILMLKPASRSHLKRNPVTQPNSRQVHTEGSTTVNAEPFPGFD